MATAGYSGTPLVQKIGIKAGDRFCVINAPNGFDKELVPIPEGAAEVNKGKNINVAIIFATKAAEMSKQVLAMRDRIEQNGMIWVSWPKKASKVPTDITEDVIRDWALKNKLVDVKVCAVNEVWSGLKLVIPVKDRSK
jgi:hypothetical protein